MQYSCISSSVTGICIYPFILYKNGKEIRLEAGKNNEHNIFKIIKILKQHLWTPVHFECAWNTKACKDVFKRPNTNVGISVLKKDLIYLLVLECEILPLISLVIQLQYVHLRLIELSQSILSCG